MTQSDIDDTADETIEELASTDFAPMTDLQASSPSAEQMESLRRSLQINMGILGKTKAELIAGVREVGPASATDAIDEINEVAKMVESYLAILQTASARMFVAVAAYSLEDETGKGGDA